ncbi:MAG: hypothetical protein JEZ03_09265 [Bacteroidales bacterium]|nr:hypothetical protein [Bacteroidales bacterium]
MNQFFNNNRTFLYSRLKFNLNRKMLFLSLGGYFGVLFMISFIIAASFKTGTTDIFIPLHITSFLIMLFLGCAVIAGRSFQDMNTSEKALVQLMIPASGFEKFIVSAVFSSIGWIIISFVSYELFAILVNSFWSGVYGLEFTFFHTYSMPDIDGEALKYIIYGYFGLHSFFFLGATAFKKYPIAKTALASFLINQAYSILFIITILILFGSFTQFGESMDSIIDKLQAIDLEIEDIKRYSIIPEIILFYMLPITLYVAAYFKLKEREV